MLGGIWVAALGVAGWGEGGWEVEEVVAMEARGLAVGVMEKVGWGEEDWVVVGRAAVG
jgi:hypothetical protein